MYDIIFQIKRGDEQVSYKAIFFDRDGTLTYFDKQKELWRDQIISQWSGK